MVGLEKLIISMKITVSVDNVTQLASGFRCVIGYGLFVLAWWRRRQTVKGDDLDDPAIGSDLSEVHSFSFDFPALAANPRISEMVMMAINGARSPDLGVGWERPTQPAKDLGHLVNTYRHHAWVDELDLLGDKFSEVCQPIRDI